MLQQIDRQRKPFKRFHRIFRIGSGMGRIEAVLASPYCDKSRYGRHPTKLGQVQCQAHVGIVVLINPRHIQIDDLATRQTIGIGPHLAVGEHTLHCRRHDWARLASLQSAIESLLKE